MLQGWEAYRGLTSSEIKPVKATNIEGLFSTNLLWMSSFLPSAHTLYTYHPKGPMIFGTLIHLIGLK
ncbi:hypothetical protein BCU83_14845 [Vibrio breoganii]|nr:hypothetical protein BCU83_14845 [Vibrio breoganii]